MVGQTVFDIFEKLISCRTKERTNGTKRIQISQHPKICVSCPVKLVKCYLVCRHWAFHSHSRLSTAVTHMWYWTTQLLPAARQRRRFRYNPICQLMYRPRREERLSWPEQVDVNISFKGNDLDSIGYLFRLPFLPSCMVARTSGPPSHYLLWLRERIRYSNV